MTWRNFKIWLEDWKVDDDALITVDGCNIRRLEMNNEGNVSIDIDLENSELCSDFMDTIHDLKQEVDDLESRNAELEQELSDREEDCNRIQSEKDDADAEHEAAVKELEDRLQYLMDELQATKDELDGCRIELQFAYGENENLRTQVIDLESRNVDWRFV